MKHLLIMLILIIHGCLGAVYILNESITGVLPSGWGQTGSASSNRWAYTPTANAGGSSGELRMNWSPAENGTFRYISPSFDTRKVHDMTLTFRNMVDWYASSFTLAVQLTNDMTNWTTVWSITPTADVAANQVTVPISWALGKSQSTRIAFTFIGSSGNINYWYIDDIALSYTNTLGTGNWTSGTYTPSGNLIIPNGETLTLNPGVTIRFAADANLEVDGRLLANGNSTNNVVFSRSGTGYTWRGIDIENVAATNDSTIIMYSRVEGSYSSGIYVYNSDKVRISNCIITNNKITGSYWGGGLRSLYSDLVLENSEFSSNVSDLSAPAASFSFSTPTVRYNVFYNHTFIVVDGVVNFQDCDLDNVRYNQIVGNSFSGEGAGVYMYNCSGLFLYNLISNNSAHGIYIESDSAEYVYIYHCNIVNNSSCGIYSTTAYFSILNTILWGNIDDEVYALNQTSTAYINNCCVQGGFTSVHNLSSLYYNNNIEADPLFRNPTNPGGYGQYSLTADWTLQDASPCIDAGYSGGSIFNPDGSIPDIGIYYRQLKPIITTAADVTPDQGHQLDLRWNRSDMDTTWDPSAWYNVFRLASSRAAGDPEAVLVTDPSQITPEFAAANRKINWFDGNRTYTYLAQIKAFNFADYSMIVPTLQDSTSTGLHAETYMVIYYNNARFSQSVNYSGYSVDNIPPLAARNPVLAPTSGSSFNLSWDEVTEGAWEGNTYPETNQITYKVYASSTPDFMPAPENYLLSTTSLSALLTGQNAERRFFKILVSDSE